MFQTKVVEIIKIHILCSVTIFKNSAVYGIKWKNAIQPDRPQTIEHVTCKLHAVCLRLQTHPQNILLTFPLQQWLHKSTSLFCHMYIQCLSCLNLNSNVNNAANMKVQIMLDSKLTVHNVKGKGTVHPRAGHKGPDK